MSAAMFSRCRSMPLSAESNSFPSMRNTGPRRAILGWVRFLLRLYSGSSDPMTSIT